MPEETKRKIACSGASLIRCGRRSGLGGWCEQWYGQAHGSQSGESTHLSDHIHKLADGQVRWDEEFFLRARERARGVIVSGVWL